MQSSRFLTGGGTYFFALLCIIVKGNKIKSSGEDKTIGFCRVFPLTAPGEGVTEIDTARAKAASSATNKGLDTALMLPLMAAEVSLAVKAQMKHTSLSHF